MRILGLPLLLGLLLTVSCSPKSPGADASSNVASAQVAANHATVDNAPLRVEAATLDPSKAEAMAEADFNSGNCRLYVVHGYALSIPGVDDGKVHYGESASASASSAGETSYHVITIDGTSDSPGPYDAQGRAFAETYNQVALKNCGQPL